MDRLRKMRVMQGLFLAFVLAFGCELSAQIVETTEGALPQPQIDTASEMSLASMIQNELCQEEHEELQAAKEELRDLEKKIRAFMVFNELRRMDGSLEVSDDMPSCRKEVQRLITRIEGALDEELSEQGYHEVATDEVGSLPAAFEQQLHSSVNKMHRHLTHMCEACAAYPELTAVERALCSHAANGEIFSRQKKMNCRMRQDRSREFHSVAIKRIQTCAEEGAAEDLLKMQRGLQARADLPLGCAVLLQRSGEEWLEASAHEVMRQEGFRMSSTSRCQTGMLPLLMRLGAAWEAQCRACPNNHAALGASDGTCEFAEPER